MDTIIAIIIIILAISFLAYRAYKIFHKKEMPCDSCKKSNNCTIKDNKPSPDDLKNCSFTKKNKS